MNDETLKEAIKEAKRFIRAADQVGVVTKWCYVTSSWVQSPGRTNAINAAIKRASLDLTKKLADLRMGR